MQLLLGAPPLGPDGVWSAVDPYAAYRQEPSLQLVDLVLDSASSASRLHVSELVSRASTLSSPFAEWAEMFPGEHYRFLAGLTAVLQPQLIIEVGTYTGASALAFLARAPSGARVVSYDLIGWADFADSLLQRSDFEDGRFEQRLGDLADPHYWQSQVDLFLEADLVFLDGPKDGVFEPLLLGRLADLRPMANFVLVVDDIRFMEMLGAWAAFPPPKLDATTFGHWSGTGVAIVGKPVLGP